MKRVFAILTLVVGLSLGAFSQVNPHAIGLRLGGSNEVGGAEISYQHGMGDINRVEVDLGFKSKEHYSNMSLCATYQWVWNIVEDLNWYAGPGAAVGFWNSKYGEDKDSGASFSFGGQVGLEYDFNTLGAPILVSLDFRPMFEVIEEGDSFGWGTALGVRYTF